MQLTHMRYNLRKHLCSIIELLLQYGIVYTIVVSAESSDIF